MKQTKITRSAIEAQLQKECRNMEAALHSAGYSIEQIQSIKENGWIQLCLDFQDEINCDCVCRA